ncbi:MAG: DEAD/DEAH box helicase [Rhodoferax sp.]|nr:DEAD/DEAH box helicase [Rhodoferax sp.]
MPAAHVAQQVLNKYRTRLTEKAICLTTPVPKMVPLSTIGLSEGQEAFLKKYERRTEKDGLYSHQATVVGAIKDRKKEICNIVMTTATGSGKSLAFWVWAYEILCRSKDTTVLATFPTQALLWGQAKRLAAMSEPNTLIEYSGLDDIAFAGTIKVGQKTIPWSVWYGTSGCEFMKTHEKSKSFSNARIRISTVDKAHWNLMREDHSYFLKTLSGVIIDEAHSWHGLSGANVRRMIDRMRLSLDVLDSKQPAFFLASATLANASKFAEDLTGISAKAFFEINDSGAVKASLVSSQDVPKLLKSKATVGLLRRYVFLIKPDPKPLSASAVLGNAVLLGKDANALCFVQSKFVGHRLRQDLVKQLPEREVIAYDADLPAKGRRVLERDLFDGVGKSKVIVGTSALELGVDLPTLDIVVMDDLPPRRCDLLQRLGRVGRSSDRPGLAVLCLGYSPTDERLIETPLEAVSVDNMKPLPLPLHLDVVRLQSMAAALYEWKARLTQNKALLRKFNCALTNYYGAAPTFYQLKSQLSQELGGLVDMDASAWYYKGFRVSASQGKVNLILDGTNTVVATIEDMAIFRDAHPEGIYLGHRGVCFRVKNYVGKWNVAEWQSPDGVVLGKFMKGLDHIVVTPETPTLATRGRWTDAFKLTESKDLPEPHDKPTKGSLIFGIFEFIRQFNGYQEIDLQGKQKTKIVSLTEISKRFGVARDIGADFPFLHRFSYRTKGWTWNIVNVLKKKDVRDKIAPVLGSLLQGYICDAVECSRNDLQVTMAANEAELRVVDATPGGNGLSEALLSGGRVAQAWQTALKQIKAHGANQAVFRRFIAEECRVDVNDSQITYKELCDAIKLMANAW